MSVTIISPQDFSKRLASGDTIELIDVRTPVEFREVHVDGAQNVPLDQLNPQKVQDERNGSPDDALYIICKSGARGQQACQKFLDAGFTNIVNVDGGTEACVSVRVGVVRGKKAMSLERQVRIAAGSLVVLGVVLSQLVHINFIGLSAFVGVGLIFAGITDTCGMGMMLAKMPWNQCETSCCKR